MLEGIMDWLKELAVIMPLPVFVTVGTVIEELIAPIPSPVVNSLAGSMAAAQGSGFLFLLWLGILSGIAKTVGTLIFYVLGDKLEDAVIPRFGRYIGVNHEDLERFGSRFQGGWKDDVMLFILRAIPVMPSTPVSVACGVLKISLRTYLVSTVAGFFVRDFFFIILGYSGLQAAETLLSGVTSAESYLTAAFLVGVIVLLAWLYWRRQRVHPAGWLEGKKPSQKEP